MGAGLYNSTFSIYCRFQNALFNKIIYYYNKKVLLYSVPSDFNYHLEQYTQKGYRVLGLAHRDLPGRISYPKMQRLLREEVEADLCFLGLVVLENRLKHQTKGVIDTLKHANIRTIMVTG